MKALGLIALLILGGCATVEPVDYWADLDHIYRMDIDSAPRIGEVSSDPLAICKDRDVARGLVQTMQEMGFEAWYHVTTTMIDSGECVVADGIILIEVGEMWRSGYAPGGATVDIWDVLVADRENVVWWSSYYQRTGVTNPSEGT